MVYMLNPEFSFEVDVKNYPLRVKVMLDIINDIMCGRRNNAVYVKTLAYVLVVKILNCNPDLAEFLDLCTEDLNQAPY